MRGGAQRQARMDGERALCDERTRGIRMSIDDGIRGVRVRSAGPSATGQAASRSDSTSTKKLDRTGQGVVAIVVVR